MLGFGERDRDRVDRVRKLMGELWRSRKRMLA